LIHIKTATLFRRLKANLNALFRLESPHDERSSPQYVKQGGRTVRTHCYPHARANGATDTQHLETFDPSQMLSELAHLFMARGRGYRDHDRALEKVFDLSLLSLSRSF